MYSRGAQKCWNTSGDCADKCGNGPCHGAGNTNWCRRAGYSRSCLSSGKSSTASLEEAWGEEQEEEAPDEEDEPAPVDPRTLVENWCYVTNPGNPDASTQSILPASRDANEEAVSVLDAYFRSQRIDPIIKTQSIANALLHYVDMPPTVRTLVPHENVEGQSWSKLKRGKLRILVRFAEDDQLHFHIYNRREWRRREE